MIDGIRRIRTTANRLLRDRGGVAAIEFAFIAPILLCMYLMTMEVSQGIETNKKLSRAGSMAGDLVAQQADVKKSEVEAILRIADSLLQPYNRSQPTITVTAIQVSDDPDNPQAKVKWSRKMAGSTFSAGPAEEAVVTVPDTLLKAGAFLIRVESALTYKPVILYSASQKEALGLQAAFDGISMNETSYHRSPRMSTVINCGDC